MRMFKVLNNKDTEKLATILPPLHTINEVSSFLKSVKLLDMRKREIIIKAMLDKSSPEKLTKIHSNILSDLNITKYSIEDVCRTGALDIDKKSEQKEIQRVTSESTGMINHHLTTSPENKMLPVIAIQENDEIISHIIKTINKSIHSCVWFNTDRLLAALPNNKVILACSSNWPKSQIYLIDPDDSPPSTPLLTIEGKVTCIASCPNNNFLLGTESADIYLISEENGNILNHRKIPHDVYGERHIECINVFPNNNSIIVRSKKHLYAWNNFHSETKPSHSLLLTESSHDSQILLLNNSEGSYIIHGTRSGVIGIYNANNLELIKTCNISLSRNLQGINIYFIKPDSIDTNSFYIGYTHCHTNAPPMVVKGNLHTIDTFGLVHVMDLTSINSGQSIGNRFGIYMNESMALIPGGIIASNDKITALCHFDSPQTIKKFPTSTGFGLDGLTILPDGRIFQIDKQGKYQCYMLKSVQNYLSRMTPSIKTVSNGKSQLENNRHRKVS